HLEAAGRIDDLAVHRYCAVGYAHNQFTLDQALDLQVVQNFLAAGEDLAGEFDLATTEGAPLAGVAPPAEVKAHQLPHGVQPQTTRHYRIVLKMAVEEPEVRADVELGDNTTLALTAAVGVDFDDAVHHQHVA